MKQSNLKNRVRTTTLILCFALLLLWVVFYIHTSRFLEKNNEKNMNQASKQVINAMESEFLNLEHIAFNLSQSKQVKEFVKEKAPLRYYEKSADVSELLDTLTELSTFIKDIIIYNRDNVYCRFMGKLGNTASKQIFYKIDSDALPQHMILDLEGVNYVGYASGIYDDNRLVGTVVILMDEDKLRSLFSEYNGLDYLKISLAADGKVITSNNAKLTGMTVKQVRENAKSFVSRKIGVTPFEVFVSSDDTYIVSARNEFAVPVAITAILFAVLLILFFAFWSRYFFRPMFSVMHGVEQLGVQNKATTLKFTGEVNFDRLVNKINSMLIRLDEKNKALLEAQFKLQDSEIQKQKAVIISLKKQINAHFTVNVLSVIKLLAQRCEMQKTGEMCDGLSYLLQYANSEDEFIDVLEEFFIIEKYITIMDIRYQNRFIAEFDLDERLDDIRIPRMLVQPIIENAIMHGFKYLKKDGKLIIRAALEGNKLNILVSDNGCGMDENTIRYLRDKIESAENQAWDEKGLEHIALPNIQRRVISYYGEGYGLTLESKVNEGTSVMLTLPA